MAEHALSERKAAEAAEAESNHRADILEPWAG